MARDTSDIERLPTSLETFLRETNPWWAGEPAKTVPPFHRRAFQTMQRKLEGDLAPIVVVRGPRQVGKTTLQLQLIQRLLEQGHPADRILRVQFDDLPSLKGVAEPVLTLGRWFQHHILAQSFNVAARGGPMPLLCLDEVQNLADWAPQLKALVDHHSVKVLVTGSSALRIEAGRDSLAGRITQVELGTLLLGEIAGLRFGEQLPALLPANGLEALLNRDFWEELARFGPAHAAVRDRAFTAYAQRGGYPIAHARAQAPWPEVADHLNETVIQRAIQHDLRMGERGQKRDPQLLEEVFRLACRYAGQSPGQSVLIPEIHHTLQANIGWQRIRAYLRFLDGAMLLRLIPPLELRLKRRRGQDKICLCDHALRASWLQEQVPLEESGLADNPHMAELAGHIAESTAGYFLAGLPHLDVAHFPERGSEPEVDFVLTIGEQRIPIEIKYRRRIDPHRDTLGLRAFLEKTVYNAPFAILVTMHDHVRIDDPRIITLSLPTLLLMR